MKSSPMHEYFICTDWHHTSKKCQYPYCVEQQRLLRNHKQAWYRLPKYAQKVSGESQVSSLPPWLKAGMRTLTVVTKSSTRGCQTVIWTNLLIIQAINLEVKGFLPHE